VHSSRRVWPIFCKIILLALTPDPKLLYTNDLGRGGGAAFVVSPYFSTLYD
jgi:hypothetical protein